MKALHIHLYKSLSYRILSVCITFIISFGLIGSATVAGTIASIDALIKFVVYFLHERLWAVKFLDVWKENAEKPKSINTVSSITEK